MSRKADGTIIAPVNTDDVMMSIGVSSHDIGTLCTSDKQRWWVKFKAMRHDTSPAPYTNAERKAKYWGIQTVTKKISTPISSTNITWEHLLPQASDYKVLNDFIGDGADEGYNPGAAPVVEAVISKRGSTITTKFTFNRNTTPGGILPSEMLIEGLSNAALSTLYPGIIIYRFNDGTGNYDPIRIGTADVKVGEHAGLEVQLPVSGLSINYWYAVLPILSTQSILMGSTSGRSENVLFVPDSYISFELTDSWQGTILYPKYKIEYLKASSGSTTTGLFMGNSNTSYLSLNPTVDMTNIYNGGVGENGDKRIAVNMKFLEVYNGDYGLANWNPIAAYVENDGSMTQSSFNIIKNNVYYIGLFSFSGTPDSDDTVYLCLKFSCVTQTGTTYWNHENDWKVTFDRHLVLVDTGKAAANMDSWATTGVATHWATIVMDRGFTSIGTTTKMERITKIQIANAVTADYSARGVDVKMVGANGHFDTHSNYTATQSGPPMRADDVYMSFYFNNRNNDSSLSPHSAIVLLPVNTKIDIAITVDTIDTMDETVDNIVDLT